MTQSDPTQHLFREEWQQWHTRLDEIRSRPAGFLSADSLTWLTTTPQRISTAPGRWYVDATGPVVELEESALEVLTDTASTTLTIHHAFGSLPDSASVFVHDGALVIEIARRGDDYLVRTRNPDNALRRDFAGTPHFEPRPEWAIAGRLTPADSEVTVGSVKTGISYRFAVAGVIEFPYGDEVYRLSAYRTREEVVATTEEYRELIAADDDAELIVEFSDATSGQTTPGGRALTISAPGPDGEVVLDFNRAAALPCAYSPHAACPLPPRDNVLPFAVEAGEKRPVAEA